MHISTANGLRNSELGNLGTPNLMTNFTGSSWQKTRRRKPKERFADTVLS